MVEREKGEDTNEGEDLVGITTTRLEEGESITISNESRDIRLAYDRTGHNQPTDQQVVCSSQGNLTRLLRS